MKKFIILGRARSGTTVIGHALADHPEVLFYGELFHGRNEARILESARKSLGAGVRCRKEYQRYGVRPCSKTESGYGYLEYLYSLEVPFKSVGFKFLYHHVLQGPNRDAWNYVAAHHDLSVIHIIRHNLLEMACSFVRANMNIQYHANKPVNCRPFEFSPVVCESIFNELEQKSHLIKDILDNHKVLNLDYSLICENFQGSMYRIFSFLGVDKDIASFPKLIKIANLTPDEEIINYDELKEYFKDTRYSKYFIY
jgi:LPS sulfotransferase NodH